MSRLSLMNENKADQCVEELYKDIERRVQAAQPGLCPVDIAVSFLHICHSQSCGKCTPCRIGLGQLEKLIHSVLDGTASMETLDLIEKTAQSVYLSADCAIGYQAAQMVLKGLKGFRDDYEEHILHGRCRSLQTRPVPCVYRCPAQVDIPGYIALIHEGRYDDAVALIRKDNPFPAVCGLICEHPCEIHCRRTFVDDPVNIRGLKRFAAEREGEAKLPRMFPKTGKKVAVIGGGPSGLSAAYYLSVMGHEVTIYEQRKQLGGMLRYGIPSYRLPRETLDKEIADLQKTGFKAVTDVRIGTDISVAKLKEENDAVYVAIGAHTGHRLRIDGEDAQGVLSAVNMLRMIGDNDLPDLTGLDCVVIGGGNVAMDVARSAVRLGAESVTIVYRRRKADMTALPEEIEGAIADGCEILEMHAPVRIEKDDNGCVSGIYLQPQVVGPIERGRPAPVKADTDEIRMPCSRVLVAVGQGIDSNSFGEEGIPIDRGRIRALDSCGISTDNIGNTDGIFAGGDCVTGPATVIRAIAAGKVAAANIDEYLGFEHEIISDIELPNIHFCDDHPCGRVNMKERPAAERKKDFGLMEYCMTPEEAHQESGRCLHCDHFGYGIFKGGRIKKW
ncbi:MAG: FAD-dependent oxidoreductase [Oscillospiraceae bacterium]|nr:FAD-dependent oxidoreductase [Oscillospiraceae bacterium]